MQEFKRFHIFLDGFCNISLIFFLIFPFNCVKMIQLFISDVGINCNFQANFDTF